MTPASSSSSPDGAETSIVLSMLRYWRTSVAIVVVAAIAAYLGSSLLPERYQADVIIELADPATSLVYPRAGVLPPDLERYTLREVDVVQSSEVLRGVTEQLPGTSVEDLRGRIRASAETPGQITIEADASTAGGAADLANAVTEAYSELSRQAKLEEADVAVAALQTQIDEIDAEIDSLNDRIALAGGNNPALQSELQGKEADRRNFQSVVDETEINAEAFGDGITFVDEARPPERPTEPKPLRNAGVAGLVAVLAAGVLAAFRARRQATADDSSIPAELLNAPMIGPIPELGADEDLPGLGQPGSPGAESYQLAVAALKRVFPWCVLLVTSGSRGDGKTVTAANVAASVARNGTRVVLVDGDPRSGRLTDRLLGAAERSSPGLCDLARGEVELDQGRRLLTLPDGVTLPFVPAGSSGGDVGTLFRTAGMAATVQRLRAAYDLVIIDTAPMLAVADVASLAGQADGITLVVRHGTPIAVLTALRQRLSLISAPLIGFVFTRAPDAPAPYDDNYGLPTTAASREHPRHLRKRRRTEAEARYGQVPAAEAAEQTSAPSSNGPPAGDGSVTEQARPSRS